MNTKKIVRRKNGVTLTEISVYNGTGGKLDTRYQITSGRTPVEPIFSDLPTAEAAFESESLLSSRTSI